MDWTFTPLASVVAGATLFCSWAVGDAVLAILGLIMVGACLAFAYMQTR